MADIIKKAPALKPKAETTTPEPKLEGAALEESLKARRALIDKEITAAEKAFHDAKANLDLWRGRSDALSSEEQAAKKPASNAIAEYLAFQEKRREEMVKQTAILKRAGRPPDPRIFKSVLDNALYNRGRRRG